jgi:ATP-dependent Lhr-like helicase
VNLPPLFADWFASRGWQPRPHQLAMLDAAAEGASVLLIAPTGGGKTLAGFLPSLVDLSANSRPGLHTLYVSPLKALTSDIARNLIPLVQDLRLPVAIETRTGDTPANRRARQRTTPPHILLTTPESLAVLLSQPDAPAMFGRLATLVTDEVHALAGTKRGDQLALCAARLGTLAPKLRRVGLSATVRPIDVADGAPPDLSIMLPPGELSWAGHMGIEAAPQVMARIRAATMTIVFVNTRAQAELIFQALWRLNDPTLPIALHHGSLDVAQRRRVEAAMAEGRLRAVVATSSLDLGIDWGGVDQVIQLGAPKGISRLLQRVGRANHRMEEPSRAVLVPSNRFELLECEAAIQGVAARELDGDPPRPGGLDVLAQHLLGMACSAPFNPDEMFAEIRRAAPYADLPRKDFDAVLEFVENGGYALAAYDRYRKLFRDSKGRVHVRSERIARQHRMNIGTIVDAPQMKVRLVGKKRFGPVLGEVEEAFINLLRPGDTVMFAGRLLRFLRVQETVAEVAEGGSGEPMVPAYEGGRLPLTTNLADRVRRLERLPGTRATMAAAAEGALPPARPQRPIGGDLPPRRPLVPDRLLLRGPQRPSDARDVADETDGARRLRAAGFRRHRLRAGHLVGRPALRRGAAVRRGHAGRRPGKLDGGKLDAAPQLPQRSGHCRADRASPSRRREDPTSSHNEQRPDLRRAAQAPAGTHPAARNAGRRCRRPDRPRPRRRDAAPSERPHRSHGTVPRLPARRAGTAGYRSGERALGRR